MKAVKVMATINEQGQLTLDRLLAINKNRLSKILHSYNE